jgi:hypothetical protein
MQTGVCEIGRLHIIASDQFLEAGWLLALRTWGYKRHGMGVVVLYPNSSNPTTAYAQTGNKSIFESGYSISKR